MSYGAWRVIIIYILYLSIYLSIDRSVYLSIYIDYVYIYIVCVGIERSRRQGRVRCPMAPGGCELERDDYHVYLYIYGIAAMPV